MSVVQVDVSAIECAADTTTDHFVCCETPDDAPTRTHCGLPDEWTGDFVDDVDCVVCNEIEHSTTAGTCCATGPPRRIRGGNARRGGDARR